VEVDAPAGAKLRATVRVDDQVALGHEQSAPAEARRQLPPEAPTALPLAKRETAAEASPDLDRQRQPLAATPQQPAQQHEVAAGEGQLEASHPAQPAPVGEPTEPTAAFDLRTAELPAAAVDSLAASPWDADRVRGALALVMQSRPPRDVEAAIGELLFALEDAPRPTKGFARSARRQPLSPPAALRAPDASSASRQTPEAAAQQFDAQGGVTTKDLVPRQTEATPSAAPAWSSLPATSAATSLVDSAAAALLLRMPELPDGAVRDRAVRWLQLQGLR
jgi:hypothetical protein